MVKISEEDEVVNKKFNKSLYFLLPMLGLQSGYFANIINCYISDRGRQDIDNYHIFLLFKYKDDKIRGVNGFKEEYVIEEGCMYVFRIPYAFEEDYLKFILGKYSEFSEAYKEQIKRLLPKPIVNQNVYKVIMKTEDAKKLIENRIGASIGNQEVMSVPNFEDECYG